MALDSGRRTSMRTRRSLLTLLVPSLFACSEAGPSTSFDASSPPVDAGGADASAPDAEPVAEIALLAGSLGSSGNLDGPRAVALFSGPSGVARGPDGSLFVADTSNLVIRRIAPDGEVSLFAGAYGEAGTTDGRGAEARFALPVAIVAAADGTLFVSDTHSSTVRRIAPDGTVTTWLGRAGQSGGADGPRSQGRLRAPEALALDAEGRLYIVDREGHTLRRASPEGDLETLVGQDGELGSDDGAPREARLAGPFGVAVAPDGTVAIADTFNNTIRVLAPGGEVVTLAGRAGVSPDSTDGVGAAARFAQPRYLGFLSDGSLLVSDTANDRLRRVTSAGEVTTFAGSSRAGSKDGALREAQLSFPGGFIIEGEGEQLSVHLAEIGSSILRRITLAGVETFAGRPTELDHQDGPALEARFFRVGQVLAMDDGSLSIADQFSSVLRRLGTDGLVETWAGVAGEEGTDDGDRGAARFGQPWGLISDRQGGYFVSDAGNHLIRHIDADGQVTLHAGGPTLRGQTFVDGPRLDARFLAPHGLALDGTGNLYVADAANHAIRKIALDGEVTTVAGVGLPGFEDGPGGGARFNHPVGLVLVDDATLLVADAGNHLLRKVVLQPSGALVSTLAGLPPLDEIPRPGRQDGRGPSAGLNTPLGLLADGEGAFLVADSNNSLIRRVTLDGEVATFAGTRGLLGVRPGPLPGALFEPLSLARAPDGRVLVGFQTGVLAIGVSADARRPASAGGR